ncbi:MAG TPA: TadA family conjugal transfer-associated ATPase [Jatrophihabitans sp.]|nr:TadA family conjugal transfer-associated ATPase [Jatrophihabitans sp.]
MATRELVERVRRRLADEPARLDDLLRAEFGGIVDDVAFDALRRDVEAELHGAGALEPLLATPGVTDVLVNGPRDVWLDRGRGLERAPVTFDDDAAVRRLAQRLATSAGARLDDALPYADAVLGDGTRLHAVLPPLVEHPTISLRVLARRRLDLGALVAGGAVPVEIAEVLRGVIAARLAFIVSGGTGTGKTTLLGAMLGTVPAGERILLIEDAAELHVAHPHVVRLVPRGVNVEGAGAVGQRELVRQALRMRPDRLVVGEFRGAEMLELIVALNTGHEGGAATLHANSAADVPARFTALGALGGLPAAAVTSLVASAIDVVVHLRRGSDGQRVVSEIGLLSRVVDELVVEPAWSMQDGGCAGWPQLCELVQRRGGGL